MEEDHNTVYFITPPVQSSADEKEEMAVKAGKDTRVEKGLQAGKEKKAMVVRISAPTPQTNNFSFCKKVTGSFSALKISIRTKKWNRKLNYLNDWVKSPEDGAKPETAGPGLSVRNPLVSSESTTQYPVHKHCAHNYVGNGRGTKPPGYRLIVSRTNKYQS